MKKTISLTDDQVMALCTVIRVYLPELERFLRSAQERGKDGLESMYKKDIDALKQVREKIKRAKWTD